MKVLQCSSNIILQGRIYKCSTSLNSADVLKKVICLSFHKYELKDGTYLAGYNQLGSMALAPSLRNIMDGLKGAVANFVINVLVNLLMIILNRYNN